MIFDLIDRFAPYAAWACLAAIAFVTLSPIGARPIVAAQGIEHVAAFALVAALFCLAYPRHTLLVLVLLIFAAGLLEVLQTLVPGRHGRVIDAIQKCIGAGGGAVVAYVISIWR